VCVLLTVVKPFLAAPVAKTIEWLSSTKRPLVFNSPTGVAAPLFRDRRLVFSRAPLKGEILSNKLSPCKLTIVCLFQGHYCPLGTVQPDQFNCQPGSYTNRTDLYTAEQCDICPEGYYCTYATSTFAFSYLFVRLMQLKIAEKAINARKLPALCRHHCIHGHHSAIKISRD